MLKRGLNRSLSLNLPMSGALMNRGSHRSMVLRAAKEVFW